MREQPVASMPNASKDEDKTTSGGCCGPAHATREDVRVRYAQAAESAGTTVCCDSGAGFGAALYSPEELGTVPGGASLMSLGCGNPSAVAELNEGEVVLDLGSGAGIDVLLSARRVGPSGKAYGLDMTDEMLELARRNQAEAGVENVEFLQGYIEQIPLPDRAVDVIISNCVVNLSTDKPSVFAEMHRVLVPGGRIGLSDVVAADELSRAEIIERGTHVGCIAGALRITEYVEYLEAAGFQDVDVVPTHAVGDDMFGAIVKAVKP